MTQTNAILISGSIAITGFIPLLIAIYKHRRDKRLMDTGIQTPGFVEELHKRHDVKGNTYYQALVNFPAGTTRQRHYFTTGISRYKTLLAKVNTVTIIYNPGQTQTFPHQRNTAI